MKSIASAIGNALFWATWPALFVYLYPTRRTRILVVAEGEVLLGKRWLGSGDWHTIGGGIRKNETPMQGAKREVFEETGLQLEPSQLREIKTLTITRERGLVIHYVGFIVELSKKPEIIMQKTEMSDLEWFPLRDIASNNIGGQTVYDLVAAWKTAH